jgi:DNA mismatch endonuclease, patch repair protein
MGRIRSRGTKSTEKRLRALLVAYGMRGWALGHDTGLPGRPDVVFSSRKLAVFVDGCFWHRCRKCRSLPVSNVGFWRTKILGNQARDRRATRELRKLGWAVLRIWEHELRDDGPAVIDRLRIEARCVQREPIKRRESAYIPSGRGTIAARTGAR